MEHHTFGRWGSEGKAGAASLAVSHGRAKFLRAVRRLRPYPGLEGRGSVPRVTPIHDNRTGPEMNQTTSEEVLTRIDQAAELYHRLVLVVGPASSGKTQALQRLAVDLAVRVINVNLEASRRLLELTERQRRLELPAVLDDLIGESDTVVLLDNTEILFDMSLEHDPLRLLQKLSRSRTVVGSWNGNVQDGYLIYGAPEHPEYRRYAVRDIVVLQPREVLR